MYNMYISTISLDDDTVYNIYNISRYTVRYILKVPRESCVGVA